MKKILALLALVCAPAFAEVEYRFSQISVRDEKSALEIIRKIKEGAEFDVLARELSLDTSTAENGGDMGWNPLTRLDESTASILKGLKVSEPVSEPIRFGSYWRVLKLKDRRSDGETYLPQSGPEAERQHQVNRAAIQALRTNTNVPAFISMPAVSEANLTAPAGSTLYNKAYKTSGGCIFFYVRTQETVATHAIWKGPACNGKPLKGKGVLQITAMNKNNDNTSDLIQQEMQGQFEEGLLTGAGQKTTHSYTTAKAALMNSWRLTGNFAFGILNGQGKRRWFGAPNQRPNAEETQGYFDNGSPSGLQRQIRSQPYEGVQGDVLPLVYGQEGKYIEQAQWQGRLVEGTIYAGTNKWTMFVQSWNGNSPAAAVIMRAPGISAKSDSFVYLLTSCNNWQTDGPAWSCKEGMLSFQKSAFSAALNAGKVDFSLSLQPGTTLLQVTSNPPVQIGKWTESEKSRGRCNASWTECAGAAMFPIGAYHWRGESVYRNGEILPIGPGEVLTGDPSRKDRNIVVRARCARFTSPTECDEGSYYLGQTTLEGRFRLKNLQYVTDKDGMSGYQQSDRAGIEMIGWSKLVFPSGNWAKVRMGDNGITDVGECDKPGSSDSFTCRLEDQTVVFVPSQRSSSRNERRSDSGSDRTYYSAPERTPDRFVPTPVPQRQQYVLPGMR